MENNREIDAYNAGWDMAVLWTLKWLVENGGNTHAEAYDVVEKYRQAVRERNRDRK